MDYRKPPKVDASACIARNATVLGDVELGPQVTVLFNATLRGDCGGQIIVGAQTNIQEGACVHVNGSGVTRIGSRVTVGHGAIIHCGEVGDGTLVGMGATLLGDAHIGKNCLIGAGALVTGKMDAPDGSLILGSPAKVVRPLTPEEIVGLSENVEEYLKIGAEMADQGILLRGEVPQAWNQMALPTAFMGGFWS